MNKRKVTIGLCLVAFTLGVIYGIHRQKCEYWKIFPMEMRNEFLAHPTFESCLDIWLEFTYFLTINNYSNLDSWGKIPFWDLIKETTDSELLRKLESNKKLMKDVNIYSRIIHNPSTPVEVLRKLANDKYWGIREEVAKSINCPVSILKKLSKDEERYVRESVAENKNCSPEILRELSGDKDNGVLLYVTMNPNTPVDILEKFAKDKDKNKDKRLREFAKRTLDKISSKNKSSMHKDNLEFEIIDTDSDGYGSTGGGQFTSEVILKVKLNEIKGNIEIYGYCNNFDELEEMADEYESETDNSDEAQELLDSLTTKNTEWATSEEDIKESVEEFLENEEIELSEDDIYSIVKVIKQNINKYIKQLFPVNKRILNKADKLWERIYG